MAEGRYDRVIRNVRKMISQGAPEFDIDGYLRSEGLTPPQFKSIVEGPTIGGQLKEAVKGVVPGAIGLVEQAAVGASALLPDQYEAGAQEAIRGVAAAAKKPFAPEAGYEESVGRKFGEAAGSFVPFLGLGALGVAGRVGAGALATGSGAGEALTRAQQEGATSEQQSLSTGLGAVVGLSELITPFRILSRIPEGEVLTAANRIKRVALAGGEEAAQEAAAGLAQNMIARGVYKPEQQLIEGLGEQAAYGGAVGALAQGLLDVALGRRAKTAATPAQPAQPTTSAVEEQPAVTVPPAAEVTPIERGEINTEPLKAGRQMPLFPEKLPIQETPTDSVAAVREQGFLEEGKRQDKLQQLVALREEYDLVRREGERLEAAYNAEQDPAKKQAIFDQAAQIKPQLDLLAKQVNQAKRGLTEEEAARPTTPEGQGTLDFGPPDTRPLTEDDFRTMGIGSTNKKLREEILGKDLVNPEERDLVRSRLEAYAASPNRSPGIVEKVESFLNTPIFKQPAQPKEGEADVKQPEQPVAGASQPSVPVPDQGAAAAAPGPEALVTTGVGEPALRTEPRNVAEGKQPVAVEVDPLFDQAKNIVVTAQRASPSLIQRSLGIGFNRAQRILEQLEKEGVVSARGTNDVRTVLVEKPSTSEAATKPVEEKQPRPLTEIQQRAEFGKGIGATYGESLRPRQNQQAGKAVQQGSFSGVLDALEKSKNPVVQQVAKLARSLKTKIEVSDEAGESYKDEKYTSRQRSIDHAKMHLGALDYIRQVAPQIEKLPNGAALPDEVLGRNIQAYENGEATSKYGLRTIVDNNNSMFAPLGLQGGAKLRTKEDFLNLRDAIERATKNIDENKIRLTSTAVAIPQFGVDGLYDVKSDTIKITDYAVKNEGVLAHEIVHAQVANIVANPKPAQRPTVQRLNKLYEHVKQHYKKEAATEDPDFYRPPYGVASIQEFIAEGISNPKFQYELSRIKYQNTTAWDKFTEYIAKLLGLKNDNALTELLTIYGELTQPGVEAASVGTGQLFALTPAGQQAQAAVAAMAGITNAKPKGPQMSTLQKVGAFFQDPSYRQDQIDKFRVQVAYKGAAAESKLAMLNQYNGKIRDALGNIRPDVFMTAAEHADTMAVAVMKDGKLKLDPKVGWVAEKGTASFQGVIDKIKELGTKLGDQQLAFKLANDAFIARRANYFKQHPQLGISGLPDDAKIKAGMQAFKDFPELEAAFKEFTTFKNNLIDAGVDAGRFSKEQAAEWKEAADYVPWNRIKDYEDKIATSPQAYFRGLTNLKQMKEIRGGTDEINDIFDNMVGLSFWLVNGAIRNHAAVQLTDAFVSNGLGARQVRQGQPGVDPNKTIYIYRDGKPEVYEYESIADVYAFKGVESMGGPILSSFTAFANILRRTTTATPQFAASQLFQDAYRATVTSGVKNPFEVAAKVLTGAVGAYRGDATTQQLEKFGIVGAYDLMPGRAKDEIEKEFGIRQRSVLEKGLSFMESFSIASDASLRKAVFEQTLEETKSPQFPDGDVLLARYRAQEVINFKRQGANRTVGLMRQLIPFMNAYIQGMDVFYRTMTGRGVAATERSEAFKMFLGTGVKLATLATIYTMLVGGDDEYEGLRDYEKDKNFIVPGTGVKIPVAPEVGFFFKVIPERLYNYVASQGTERPQDAAALRKTIGTAAFDAFSGPNLTPQAVKPALELLVNYSFFTGTPIVGRGLEKLEPAQQFTDSTSEIAKMIGGLAGISPMKLEYFVRGTTGIAGGTVLDLSNMLFTDRPDKRLYEMPAFKTFMYDKIPGGYKEQYYDLREKVEQVVYTMNGLKAQGRAEELQEYLNDDRINLLALRRSMNQIDQQLEKMRAFRKLISNDPTMTGAEKKDQLDEIERTENDLLRAYNIPALRKEVAGL